MTRIGADRIKNSKHFCDFVFISVYPRHPRLFLFLFSEICVICGLMNETNAVETFDLVRRFGNFTAVDHIDLFVRRGSFFGFLGPNGAGKSTTIKMLTGLLAPTSGKIRVLNLDLEAEPLEVKRRIGVVPEDLNLFERLTGPEMLAFTGRMYGLQKNEIAERAPELLALMELADEPKKLIVEYSHGMKKKLSLACALIHRPEILFLDEPFEGIDAIASRTLKDLLL